MPPAAAWRPDLGLDLRVSAPRAVYVRGRGIDTEQGDELRLRGTIAAPDITGGLNLLRGNYDLQGQRLRFSSGRLGFDGAVGLDPTLDLEARVSAAGSTAILSELGTASAPRILLRGEPEMPY
jgi:translocation and assembly module TamB